MLEVAVERPLASFDLRVHLEAGSEILAIFGPSGAGKSMLLKMVAGIEQPATGYIRSGERVLYDASAGINLPARRRKVGYVPQQSALFPHLTAVENVLFPMRAGWRRPSDAARERARELLQSFGLGDRLAAYPRELSGGQQQRVALARALASDPEILLLDEPFAALDTPIRVELRQELRELQARIGIPALFVTHDLDEAAAVAGRMAVIVDGRIRQVGSVRDVIYRPVDVTVARMMQARNVLSGTVSSSGGGPWVFTPIGRLPIDAGRYTEGTVVHVIIRPEVIRLDVETDGRCEPGGCVKLTGRVVRPPGEGLRATCGIDVDGTLVDVLVSYAVDSRPGDIVRLSIALEDIHVIPVAYGL